MRKRILALSLALILLSATACNNSSSQTDSSKSSSSQSEKDSSSLTETTTTATTTSQTSADSSSEPEQTTTETTSPTTKIPEQTTKIAYDPDSQRKKYIADGETTDTDGDGLPDNVEKQIKTDPKKPDTDKDGLTDYQEHFLTGTDPTIYDSIQKGISDAKVDIENDGLSNEKEIQLRTDPKHPDTDRDGLTDGDEVNRYKTDPLNPDTDGDGISDGDEVKNGTDPLKKGSSNSNPNTNPGGYSEQPIPAASNVFKSVNKSGEPFALSMKVFASADAESKLSARETTISDLQKSKVLVGKAVDITADKSLDCRGATLYFRLDKDYVKKNLTFGKKDRDGIKALYIAYFDKQANALLPLETSYDEAGCSVSAQFTGELTTFMLVDSNVWDEDMMNSWAKSRKDFGDMMKLTI